MPERGPLFPANGATSVCRDATLRMRFDGKPTVASTGKISVFEVGGATAPVAVVDLAATMIDETVGANQLRVTRPVYVGDDEVIVRLPKNALAYGKRYYVTVPAGAIRGPDGEALMFSGQDDWQFSTRAAAPSDFTALRVAVDGTGDFCSRAGSARRAARAEQREGDDHARRRHVLRARAHRAQDQLHAARRGSQDTRSSSA